MKTTQVVYIDPNDAGRPCMSLPSLLADVASMAGFDRMPEHYGGISNRPAKGRKKVLVTITVESVE